MRLSARVLSFALSVLLVAAAPLPRRACYPPHRSIGWRTLGRRRQHARPWPRQAPSTSKSGASR